MNLFPSQPTLQIDVSIFPLMEEGYAGIYCKNNFEQFVLTFERKKILFLFLKLL